LEGRLTSIAVDPTGREFMVGSNSGKVFRLMSSSMDCTVHCEGHLQSIVGMEISRSSNDIFATIDMEGFILVWDLNDI
jgi:WD40 repeat protein